MKRLIVALLLIGSCAVAAIAGTGSVVYLPESEVSTYTGNPGVLGISEVSGEQCLYSYNGAVAGGRQLVCTDSTVSELVTYISDSGNATLRHGNFTAWNSDLIGDVVPITAWTSHVTHPFEVMTSASTAVISEATNSTGYGMVWSSLEMEEGAVYRVTFDFTHSTGEYPTFRASAQTALAAPTTSEVTVDGVNTVYIVGPATGTYYIGFRVEELDAESAQNSFSVADFSVSLVVGGNIYAVGKLTGGGDSGINIDYIGNVTADEVLDVRQTLRVWDEATLGTEIATSWINHSINPYEVFSATGGSIISAATNTSGYGICYITANSGVTILNDNMYVATFSFTLNSGTMPYFRVSSEKTLSNDLVVSKIVSAGVNTVYFYGDSIETRHIGFKVLSAIATDFSVADFSVKRATSGDIFAASANIGLITAGTITADTFSNILSGTTATNWGLLISDGTCTTFTATVSGATTSMVTVVNALGGAALENGLMVDARVSASNTVTVRECGYLAAGVTPSSRKYIVRVIK